MPAAHSWVAPQVEIGGKGGRAGGGRCPPPRRLAARGRRGGGNAPPRSGPLAVACAGGRCPAPSCCPLPTGARHSRALVRPVGPAVWRLRPSAGTNGCGGRLEGRERARSLALPAALDVMPCAHVQDAWFAGRGWASLCQDGGQQVVGWGRAHAPRALCRGRCGGRAVYGCFLCPLDTFPQSILIHTAVEASRLRSVGLGRNTRGMRVT